MVRDNGNIVELAPGISAGETVALNISNQIIDGDTVDAHELGAGLADVQKPEQ